MAKAETKIEKLETYLEEKKKELEEAQSKIMKLKDEKENTTDRHTDSREFNDLMATHDSDLYPG